MKKNFLIIIILLMVCAHSNAQDPMFSLNMFSQMTFNPAFAGSSDMINVTALNRQQWMGYSDYSPKITTLNFDAAINPFKKLPSGVGLSFTSDVFGFNNDFAIFGVYAYKLKLKRWNGTLGIGIGAGIYNSSLKADGWIPPDGDAGSDNAIPNSEEDAMSFDMSAGLYYSTSDLYVGVSATHLLEPEFDYEKAGPKLPRQYYVMAGYRMELSNPAFEFFPSMIVQTDAKVTLLSVNTTFAYNKKIWGGVSYRTDNSITGMIGAVIAKWFKVGYAYDFGFSELGSFNDGSHEIMMGFSFNVKRDKSPQQYKSIRYL